jgi:alpha-1,2-mannosyltransferase
MMLLYVVVAFTLVFAIIALRRRLAKSTKLRVAFLHPFCDDCAGGEKVLWYLIKALVDTYKDVEVAVYSVEPDKHKILDKAKVSRLSMQKRFGIDLDHSAKFGLLSESTIQIVHVPGKMLLRPWPFMTLLFQMVLPMVYTIVCLIKYPPDIFYDTTGYAFSFLSVKLFSPGTKCYAYVHYPFICNEMIDSVKGQRSGFHNS